MKMTTMRAFHLSRVPLALAVSTAAFWVGAFRLIVLSTKVLLNIVRGDHPHEAVQRLKGLRPDGR